MSETGGQKPEHHTVPRPDGASVACVRTPAAPGDRRPGVIFCGGFVSDMSGTKATYLEDACRRRGQAYVRFDYFGHGESSGRFEDGTIGRWADDAIAVLDAMTEGPQVLVGSSMGGWIAVLAAMARPGRVAGLVTVAAAADFTEDLIRNELGEEAKAALARDGVWYRPSDYGEQPQAITQRLLDEGRDNLVLRAPVPIACPVRLLHGIDDPDVPWRQSLRLAEAITGGDVRLTLVKNAGHRLSRDQDLALIAAAAAELSDGAAG
jgi:pimeloyl-ACP methyl ester carboxylesterase